jgi:hypothetical protein
MDVTETPEILLAPPPLSPAPVQDEDVDSLSSRESSPSHLAHNPPTTQQPQPPSADISVSQLQTYPVRPIWTCLTSDWRLSRMPLLRPNDQPKVGHIQ